MGSQSVTDFSPKRKKLIRGRIYEYDPRSPNAPHVAWAAGADLIGTFSKSSPYVQALTGAGVKTAYDLLFKLARDPRSVFAEYEIPSTRRNPYVALAEKISRSLDEDLSAGSKKTDSASAARDAVPRTILTTISESLPKGRAADEASLDEISAAFRKTPKSRIATLFLQNVLSSLARLSLDAARGKASPAKVGRLAKGIENGVAPTISRELVKSAEKAGVEPEKILKYVRKRRARDKVQQRVERGPSP